MKFYDIILWWYFVMVFCEDSSQRIATDFIRFCGGAGDICRQIWILRNLDLARKFHDGLLRRNST